MITYNTATNPLATQDNKEGEVKTYKHLTKEEATEFFSELYGGEHHIPGYKIYEFGHGWYVKHYGDLSTWDYNKLTTFVLMCHDKCIRGEIQPHAFKELKLIIHQRQSRDGQFSLRHPTIEQAVEKYNQLKNNSNQ